MTNCKDCDRPLTTYQGFDPFAPAEVFCAYCETNPPADVPDKAIVTGVSFDYVGEHDHSKPWRNPTNEPWRAPEPSVVDSLLRNVPVRSVTGTFISLNWANGREMAFPGYARKETTFSSPLRGRAANETLVSWEFIIKALSSPVIAAVGIWDAPTEGNLLYTTALAIVIRPSNGDTVEFQAGTIEVSLT